MLQNQRHKPNNNVQAGQTRPNIPEFVANDEGGQMEHHIPVLVADDDHSVTTDVCQSAKGVTGNDTSVTADSQKNPRQ